MTDTDYLPVEHIVAIHEAGHAVLAHALKVKLLEISISECNGLCRDGLPYRELDHDFIWDDDLKWAEKKACILLGGEMAERQYRENNANNVDIYISENDRVELAELATALHGEDLQSAQKWISDMEITALKLVDANWSKIYMLARALIQQPILTDGTCYMTGADAMRTIENARDDQVPELLHI